MLRHIYVPPVDTQASAPSSHRMGESHGSRSNGSTWATTTARNGSMVKSNLLPLLPPPPPEERNDDAGSFFRSSGQPNNLLLSIALSFTLSRFMWTYTPQSVNSVRESHCIRHMSEETRHPPTGVMSFASITSANRRCSFFKYAVMLSTSSTVGSVAPATRFRSINALDLSICSW